jgi:hypothetical protein
MGDFLPTGVVTGFARFTRLEVKPALKSNLVEHVSSKELAQLCELRSDSKHLDVRVRAV